MAPRCGARAADRCFYQGGSGLLATDAIILRTSQETCGRTSPNAGVNGLAGASKDESARRKSIHETTRGATDGDEGESWRRQADRILELRQNQSFRSDSTPRSNGQFSGQLRNGCAG